MRVEIKPGDRVVVVAGLNSVLDVTVCKVTATEEFGRGDEIICPVKIIGRLQAWEQGHKSGVCITLAAEKEPCAEPQMNAGN